MAADQDPYFALPKLYGGPAYARPRNPVPESERPFDPDDLPIVAAMTDEERSVVATLAPSAFHGVRGLGVSAAVAAGSRAENAGASASGRARGSTGGGLRLGVRALTDLLGPRSK